MRTPIPKQGRTNKVTIMEENQIVVGEYENEIHAEIAKGNLEAFGISAHLIKDDGGGMLPSLQNVEGVQLLVAESQYEKASEILHS